MKGHTHGLMVDQQFSMVACCFLPEHSRQPCLCLTGLWFFFLLKLESLEIFLSNWFNGMGGPIPMKPELFAVASYESFKDFSLCWIQMFPFVTFNCGEGNWQKKRYFTRVHALHYNLVPHFSFCGNPKLAMTLQRAAGTFIPFFEVLRFDIISFNFCSSVCHSEMF